MTASTEDMRNNSEKRMSNAAVSMVDGNEAIEAEQSEWKRSELLVWSEKTKKKQQRT
jgi:hypothetical protein